MPVEILAPQPGESVTEGLISVWYKKNGDYVQNEEPLFDFESDKTTVKAVAPTSGILSIKIPEGTTVPVKSLVGYVDEKAPAPAKTAPARAPNAAASAPKAASTPQSEVFLSPAARHMIDEQHVDARQITGTGRGGRIIKEDVLAQGVQVRKTQTETSQPHGPEGDGDDGPPHSVPIAKPVVPQPSASSLAGRETRKRMSTIRQRIAERLLQAQQSAAILTTFNEADMSAVMNLRTRYKDAFQKKYGVGLGFMSFFVKACVEALKAFPAVNGRIDGADIVYHNYHDIGVAVSTEKGLMVPVLRGCENRNFAAIEQGIVELVQKAREEKITVADLQGGTFTITNGGIFGSLLSTPILNPPQSAILGMHTIQKRPVAVDDQVVIRPMMYLALSYDHRIIDGREAVSFLVRVKECIENPDRLLLEI
jgi:2-oxoglutarate dehydrogenase E2 component (dihydrolipoamide succinyltransferase)